MARVRHRAELHPDTWRPHGLIPVGLLTAVVASLGFARDARAICFASDIIGHDPQCPVSSGVCQISRNITVETGCVLDFSGRDVVIANDTTVTIGGGSIRVKTRAFTVARGGRIDGTPGGGAPGGGALRVEAGANIAIEQSSQQGIVVFGNARGGTIELVAVGDIHIHGRLVARANTPEACGGEIALVADGDVVVAATSEVDAHGGELGCGGTIDVTAGGTADVRRDLNASAADGGEITVDGAEVVVGGKLLANGENGSGGTVEVSARGTVAINQAIFSRGTVTAEGDPGGGTITIEADAGDAIIRGEISARGGVPDGDGGEITISAGRSIDVQAGGKLNAEAVGEAGSGGTVVLEAGVDITIAGRVIGPVIGRVEVPGGIGNGEIALTAGRHLVVATGALVDGRGHTAGGTGGIVTAEAGATGPGNLTVDGTINVAGAPCASGMCSSGGGVDLIGCDVTVGSTATLDARAPGPTGRGGDTFLTARRQLTVSGRIDSDGAARRGLNVLVHPSGRPPVVSGPIVPARMVTTCHEGTCSAPACLGFCTDLCDCGNGNLDEFEECDSSPTGCRLSGAVCAAPGTGFECTCVDTCNNGIVDLGEECDGSVAETCESRGYAGGTLACVDCAVDEGDCVLGSCGDGIVVARAGEVCEPTDLAGETCVTLGFGGGGVLACAAGCAAFDTSGCIERCGDGILDPGEECDEGTANSDEPNAACRSDCTTRRCGDGIVDDLSGEACDDGNGNDSDACLGICRAAACGDGVLCTAPACVSGPGGGPEECDEGTANSDEPNAPCRSDCTAPRCGDGITDDESGEACDDANDSDSDACLGICRAAACGDGVLCTAPACVSGPGGGPEVCDGLLTCCLSTCGPRNCDDANPCTIDSCNPATGCTNGPAAGNPACDDGDPCTTADRCVAGRCSGGAAVSCDDGNPCTADACNPGSGCVHSVDATVSCDDGNPCTADACDASSGCVHSVDATATCEDGDRCTTDRCIQGNCVGTTAGMEGIGCKVGRLLGVQCEGAPLPTNLAKAISKKVAKVGKLLEKAANAAATGNAAKEQKLRQKAAKQLDAIPRKTAKAVKTKKASRRISAQCGATIDALVQENQQLIGVVLF